MSYTDILCEKKDGVAWITGTMRLRHRTVRREQAVVQDQVDQRAHSRLSSLRS
ncbi:MAG: hypothetical protein Q8S13_02970 [Dehalococcoidia bacterium]|nr:hypothetical protein [Dehalococcoidia bacterium]